MSSVTPNALTERTVGEVVSENYSLASVFKRNGIDFCCGGSRTVADACEKHGVDPEKLAAEIDAQQARTGAPADDPRAWDLDFLVDYISNTHHRYVRDQLPVLLAFSKKVARVHGDGHPELVELAVIVHNLAEDMLSHLADEEEILFPFARSMAREDGSPRDPLSPDLQQAIAQMVEEHDEAGAAMREVSDLTNGYRAPAHACNTYRALFTSLKEFEEDLHRHVHLENNILFPRVRSATTTADLSEA